MCLSNELGEWILQVQEAGTFVAGSAIFGKPSYKAEIDALRAVLAA